MLADGVAEGRRIFANTIKYVLMGTSSNFGNMFSAAGASLFLTFLPMLPSQILLNNLLYDTSQLAIPTDNVDEEQLRRPSHWDIALHPPVHALLRTVQLACSTSPPSRIMLWVFHAGPAQFRSGWFVESLATQTLVIFAIRTRRVPFFRSHPSLPLTLAALGVVTVGAVLPATPLAHAAGLPAAARPASSPPSPAWSSATWPSSRSASGSSTATTGPVAVAKPARPPPPAPPRRRFSTGPSSTLDHAVADEVPAREYATGAPTPSLEPMTSVVQIWNGVSS